MPNYLISTEMHYKPCFNGNNGINKSYKKLYNRNSKRSHSFLLNVLDFTYSHSYSFVLSLTVTHCHFLLLAVILCHSLSLVVTRCITRCHSLYHLLSFVVTRCHSMSLDVPLVCLFIKDHYFIIFCFLHNL